MGVGGISFRSPFSTSLMNEVVLLLSNLTLVLAELFIHLLGAAVSLNVRLLFTLGDAFDVEKADKQRIFGLGQELDKGVGRNLDVLWSTMLPILREAVNNLQDFLRFGNLLGHVGGVPSWNRFGSSSAVGKCGKVHNDSFHHGDV